MATPKPSFANHGNFALFAGDNYYPAGGWDDFVGTYETLDLAHEALKDRRIGVGWAQVVDLGHRAVVTEWEKSYKDYGYPGVWRLSKNNWWGNVPAEIEVRSA